MAVACMCICVTRSDSITRFETYIYYWALNNDPLDVISEMFFVDVAYFFNVYLYLLLLDPGIPAKIGRAHV